MDKFTFPLLAAAAAFLISCASEEKRGASRAVELFNGQDLNGWQSVSADPSVGMGEVWSVQDGILVCRGEPMGYLATKKNYTDFKLLVEYRWAPGSEPGNSGLFLRLNGEPKPLPRCIEFQLKHESAGDLYGFHGMQIGGALERSIHLPDHALGGNLRGVKKAVGNENPPGEWNTVEIQVQGPTILAWVNGQKVNEAINVEVISGAVGLQSEGGVIHFRRVRLTRL